MHTLTVEKFEKKKKKLQGSGEVWHPTLVHLRIAQLNIPPVVFMQILHVNLRIFYMHI